jgi:hypothetical protein
LEARAKAQVGTAHKDKGAVAQACHVFAEFECVFTFLFELRRRSEHHAMQARAAVENLVLHIADFHQSIDEQVGLRMGEIIGSQV